MPVLTIGTDCLDVRGLDRVVSASLLGRTADLRNVAGLWLR
eukprot:COSAG01_NODE_56885_length_315_cov_2.143519_2_plen_40_part_01